MCILILLLSHSGKPYYFVHHWKNLFSTCICGCWCVKMCDSFKEYLLYVNHYACLHVVLTKKKKEAYNCGRFTTD